MILELKPEHEEILEAVVRSGRSREEVLDEVFAVIAAQNSSTDWIEDDPEVAAHIERGYQEALRGELMTPEEVRAMHRESRAARKSA